MAKRHPYTCPQCGGKIGSVRHQQLRTYVDINLEDGEVSLDGGEKEVMEETWEFMCLASSDHILSAQMVATLQSMIEEQSKYGLDF
jgi:hypothetical protein